VLRQAETLRLIKMSAPRSKRVRGLALQIVASTRALETIPWGSIVRECCPCFTILPFAHPPIYKSTNDEHLNARQENNGDTFTSKRTWLGMTHIQQKTWWIDPRSQSSYASITISIRRKGGSGDFLALSSCTTVIALHYDYSSSESSLRLSREHPPASFSCSTGLSQQQASGQELCLHLLWVGNGHGANLSLAYHL
jgi:hypothetical protein